MATPSLSIEPDWTDTGANVIKVGTSPSTFSFTGDSKMCAYYNFPMQKGQSYQWEVIVDNSTEGKYPAVGVTCVSKFKQGWGLKGLLYHGNTSDGSGLIAQKFGPLLKTGDKLRMLVEVGDKLNVAYSVNGKNLGVAFSVAKYPAEPLFVVISNEGPSTFTIQGHPPAPIASFEAAKEAPVGIAGAWSLEASRYTEGGNPVELPGSAQWRPAQTKLTVEDGANIQLRLHVVNNCSFSATKSPIVVTPGPSTMMAGDDAQMTCEQKLCALFAAANKIERSGADLVVASPAASAVFVASSGSQLPATKVDRFE